MSYKDKCTDRHPDRSMVYIMTTPSALPRACKCLRVVGLLFPQYSLKLGVGVWPLGSLCHQDTLQGQWTAAALWLNCGHTVRAGCRLCVSGVVMWLTLCLLCSLHQCIWDREPGIPCLVQTCIYTTMCSTFPFSLSLESITMAPHFLS